MSDISMGHTRDRYASYGPPEPDGDELASTSAEPDGANVRLGAHGDNPVPEVHPAVPRSRSDAGEPDYCSVSLSVSLPFLSLSLSHTNDRTGHDYYAVSASVGVGVAPPVAVGVSAGKLVRDPGHPATPAELRDFLCGDSVSVRAGVGADAGVTNGATGTAIEWGAATAIGASAGFSHNWGKDCE